MFPVEILFILVQVMKFAYINLILKLESDYFFQKSGPT